MLMTLILEMSIDRCSHVKHAEEPIGVACYQKLHVS